MGNISDYRDNDDEEVVRISQSTDDTDHDAPRTPYSVTAEEGHVQSEENEGAIHDRGCLCRYADMNLPMDKTDLMFLIFALVASAVLFAVRHIFPEAGWNRYIHDIVGSFCCVLYILPRARKTPEKLDEWGFTELPSSEGWIAGAGLIVLAFAGPVVTTLLLGGTLFFTPELVTEAFGYLWSAFAQEFLLCSIFANNLSRLNLLRGNLRIPILAGLVFGLLHFKPVNISWPQSTFMMGFTALMGFTLTFYFLKYRFIWPVIMLHAIGFPMVAYWIDPLLRDEQ